MGATAALYTVAATYLSYYITLSGAASAADGYFKGIRCKFFIKKCTKIFVELPMPNNLTKILRIPNTENEIMRNLLLSTTKHFNSQTTTKAVVLKKPFFKVISAFALIMLLGVNGVMGQQFWKTTGSGTWTGANWGTSGAGPFTTAWTSGSATRFTANSTVTFAATTVGNVTVDDGLTVTVTSGGTLTTTAARIFDIGTGSTLTWTGQNWSTAASSAGFIKNGAGTWNIGAQGNAFNATNFGFTLNAGTVNLSGNNSFGGSNCVLSINGGTIQTSGGRTFANSTVNIGGNFIFTGTGNDTYSGAVGLGAATRTITNSLTSGTRIFSGVISGTSGSGLTFDGSGAAQIYIGNASNTFTGTITVSGAEVGFANNGAFGNANNTIVINGGRLFAATTAGAAASYTLASSHGIQVGSTAGTTIGPVTGGTLTYDGIITDLSGNTGILTKVGFGTLVLGGVSTYTGATSINNGTIQLTTGNDRLPTGTVLSLGQAASTNLGTLDLNGRNQTIGGLNSTSGTNTTASNNTITSTAAATLTVAGSGTYGDATNANSGIIAGAISLVKSGSGTLTLGDVNTYTGTTTISSGTLALSGSGSIANSSTITVGSSGTFDVTGLTSALTLGASQILSGSATGSNTTGTIKVATSKNFTLSAGGLTFSALAATTTPPLTVDGTAGNLVLVSGCGITVPNNLTIGTYKLIAKSGNGATVSGTAGTLTYSGSSNNTSASVAITNGELVLTVVSTDATLSALSLSAGTLSPVFASATITYTASVTNATTSITVTPTRNQANAGIQARVNGGSYSSVTSGNASGALSLNVGENTIDILVTAQDGSTTKTYTITVTRAATTPSAPTITSITPGDQQLSVAFTAPSSDGGSAITNYQYSIDGGSTFTAVSPAATTSPITIIGLSNGTPYNIQIKAVNAIGDGTATASTAATPVTTPGAPSIGTAAVAGVSGTATVPFTAPASNGGSAITSYTATSFPGGFTGTLSQAGSGTITVTGLANGIAYTFTVKATNAAGAGAASAASNSVTPYTTPDAPTIGSAVPGDGQATVTFTAPTFTGGTAITGYTVTSSPGSVTATGSGNPITITGLTNGTPYTFTVTATNAAGTSSASATSNEVTPSAIAVPVINSSLTASATYGVAATTYTITATNTPTSFSATGLPAGLSVNTSTGDITGTPTALPGNYNVTISATNAGGTGLPETLVYTIAAKTLTLPDAAAITKVYDRTNAAVVTGTLTGIINSDAVTLNGTGTFSQTGIGTGLTVTSTATLTGAKAAYYTLTQPTGLTANITTKGLTVTGATATSRAYTGGTAAVITGATLVGVISPDAVSVVGGGTFADANVANGIAVTAALSLGGADAGNYTLTQPSLANANITTAELNINGLTGANKVYDGLTTATVTGAAGYVGLVNGETFTVTGSPTFSFDNATAANGKSITTGNGGYTAPSANYTVTQPILTANITKVPLTITAADQSVAYATPVATVTGAGSYTASGFVNGETSSVIGGSATYSTTYTTATAVGSTGVTITPIVSSLTAANYSFTAASGTITVTKANQTITALTTPITKILSDIPYSAATNASSGLTVTYASNNTSVATVAVTGTVTIQGVGTATITASQAGNSNYNAAPDVTQTLTVNPNPSITATPASLAAFTTTAGTASTPQAFTVTGSNLIADILVTPPTGFEVSQTAGGGSGYAATQTLTQASGAVSKVVYVRMTSSASGTPSGNVALTSSSASTVDVAVSGTVNASGASLIAGWDFQTTTNGGAAAAAAPSSPKVFAANFGTGTIYFDGTNGSSSTWITASSGNELTAFGGSNLNTSGTSLSTTTTSPACLAIQSGTSNSANGKYAVFKFSMTGYQNLVISYATQSTANGIQSHVWEYSTNGTSWTSAETISSIGTGFTVKTLATITGLDNTSTAYLRFSGSGATGSGNTRLDNIQLNATANPTPAIIAGGGPLSSLSTTYGTESSPTSFTLAGSDLSTTISIAALSGFEFNNPSVNSTYTSTLSSISATGPTTINVRLKNSAAAGSYSGNIVCTSGSTTLNVPMAASTVNTTPITITASNANKVYGVTQSTPVTGSTAYTITSGALQNSETIGSITLTYGNGALAGNAAATSTSTITPSAATAGTFTASNYAITYATGTLTVTKAPLTITNLNGVNKPYDGLTTATSTGVAAYGGLANSETFTVTGTPVLNFDNATAGNTKAITVTGYEPP